MRIGGREFCLCFPLLLRLPVRSATSRSQAFPAKPLACLVIPFFPVKEFSKPLFGSIFLAATVILPTKGICPYRKPNFYLESLCLGIPPCA